MAAKKSWRNAGLYVLLMVVLIALGTAFVGGRSNTPNNAPVNLRYSDFVEAVQSNEISKVLIAPDRGTALAVKSDGQRAQVNLAPDKNLLNLLSEHDVDIDVQPSRQSPAWQSALGSLLFPLLLLGGLFFLLRRAQGGAVVLVPHDVYHGRNVEYNNLAGRSAGRPAGWLAGWLAGWCACVCVRGMRINHFISPSHK